MDGRRLINLPVTSDFKHTSPFGTIKSKEAYVELVKSSKNKFLGYNFKILDEMYAESSASVRYSASHGKDFRLDASVWYYFENDLIKEVIAYYHIGEVREDRQFE